MLTERGEYQEAIPIAEKLLEFTKQRYSEKSVEIARSLYNLAELNRMVARYAEAEPLYKRALEIYETILGTKHPDVATSLNQLAELYRMTARYSEAESLNKRSLSILEKSLGSDDPRVALSLNSLASLYYSTGRYAEAELLYQRALSIQERILGDNHPDIATLLINLAGLYRMTGHHVKAETILKKSIVIYETHIGRNHPYMALCFNDLATIYLLTGRYDEAEPLYKRALEIYETILGTKHPDVATSLNNLAGLYNSTGRYAEAELLYQRSLAIREEALGEKHPLVAATLANLGFYYGKTGDHQKSHYYFRKSLYVEDTIREIAFTLLTEKQKLSYMKTQEGTVYAFLSHTLRFLADDRQAVTDTFDAWLRWKGSVIESQGRYLDALTISDDPKVQEKLGQLANVRRAIAKMQLAGLGKRSPDEYRTKIIELEKEKETLETDLITMSKDFALGRNAKAADVRALSSVIPLDAAYLDFARICTYDFTENTWKKDRYILFLFIPGDTPRVRLIDIGISEDVDKHINAYLREMNRAKTEGVLPDENKLRTQASVLYRQLIEPIDPFIQKKRHLLISPDGNLNLIPFEVLTTSSGAYLMERFLTSYVGAARDMARFAKSFIQGGKSLVIADPDYDLGQKAIEEARVFAGIKIAHVRAPVSRDAKGLHFYRLPDTKDEGDAIEKILNQKLGQNVANCQDTKALEDVLFNTSSPKVLHLATHGYFLTEEETKQHEGTQDVMARDFVSSPSLSIENPMLRSGIVLAGVNTSLKEGRDEGMVTAEKILGLKLKDTDLVVLSACETGVGDVQNGEGVFGLKRAFILSGAKSLVMSLWNVPSKETVGLMASFYTFLSEGKTKAEALRQAKLGLMRKNPNPFFWGPFTMTGSP